MKWILLLFGLFVISQQVFSQAVIYHKNGEVISAYNLDVAGKNRSYNLSGDPAGVKRYISITTIDSIKYEDGSKDVFYNSRVNEKVPEEEKESFNHLLLGLDVAALTFSDNLKVALEYLPGNGFIGLYTSFSLNTDPKNRLIYEGYENNDFHVKIMRILHWNGRAGINGYIFPPGSFRLSAGLHWITGKYAEELIVDLAEEPWSATKSITDKPFNGLMLSPALNWQPTSFLRITAAIDIGTYMKPNVSNKSMLRTEILFNF